MDSGEVRDKRMEIGGIKYAQTSFYTDGTKKTSFEDLADITNSMKEKLEEERLEKISAEYEEQTERKIQQFLYDEFGMTEEQLKEKIKDAPSAIPGRDDEMWAPYCHLKNEDGVVEYNGVIFTLDYERKWLCLGDMSNMDDVIRIPLSEGGCLMVNRDNIGALGHAIGMFSPEDINRILRALKLDAKVQQMKREIDEMEDGVGKTSKEQNADSNKEAQEAAREKDNAGGFNGYAEDGKEGIFKLKNWQLEVLTRDFSEQYIFPDSEQKEKEMFDRQRIVVLYLVHGINDGA